MNFDVGAIGDRDVEIAIPSAGVPLTPIPVTQNSRFARGGIESQVRKRHILVGPLAPGRYEIACPPCGVAVAATLTIVESGEPVR